MLSWDLGWTKFKLNQLDDAVEAMGRAVALDPGDAVARWALGQVQMAHGRYAEAEVELLRAIALRDAYLPRQALGLLYHRTDRIEMAEETYREGVRLRPDDARRNGAYADFLSDLGREEEAQEYYAKVRQCDAGEQPGRTSMANSRSDSDPNREALKQTIVALMKRHLWSRVVALLEAPSARTAEDPALLWRLGWAKFKLGNLQGAIDALTAAAKLDPGDSVTRWALGTVLAEQRADGQAELELLRAIAFHDSDIARQTLGLLYHRQGNVGMAESIYRESIRLQPESSSRYQTYADFLSDIGREEEATEQYRLADIHTKVKP
jgi:tetratricopeptide (TPR) repeat protein